MANALNIELKDKLITVKQGALKSEFENMHFLCLSGFGCNADTSGTKVFGVFIENGVESYVRGYDVEKVVPLNKMTDTMKLQVKKADRLVKLRAETWGNKMKENGGKIMGSEIDAICANITFADVEREFVSQT